MREEPVENPEAFQGEEPLAHQEPSAPQEFQADAALPADGAALAHDELSAHDAPPAGEEADEVRARQLAELQRITRRRMFIGLICGLVLFVLLFFAGRLAREGWDSLKSASDLNLSASVVREFAPATQCYELDIWA